MKTGSSYFFSVILVSLCLVSFQAAYAESIQGDDTITLWVKDSLDKNPRIASDDISVSTYKGIVKLYGSAKSLADKNYAELEAKKMKGVLGVINEIIVTPDFRFDADIEHDIRRRLIHNAFIKSHGIEVNVSDGEVTLMGKVTSKAELEEIALLATNVHGVKSVVNNLHLELSSKLSEKDIKKNVLSSIKRDVYLYPFPISVEIKDGVVILTGKVCNAYEKKRAMDIAFRVVDIQKVENNLEIKCDEYQGIRATAPSPSDQKLRETLYLELNEDMRIYPLDIKIEVKSGHVILHGSVPSYYQKKTAEQDALDVFGVSGVSNKLVVMAPQREDRAILDGVEFEIKSDYALGNADIHVKVSNGIAELSGDVNTDYEKKRAGIIASRVQGVNDVVNNIHVKEFQ